MLGMFLRLWLMSDLVGANASFLGHKDLRKPRIEIGKGKGRGPHKGAYLLSADGIYHPIYGAESKPSK